MEEAYELWRKDPSPERMGELLDKADPVLRSALQSYAGGNDALRSKARKLAVGAFQTYDPKKGAKLRTHVMTQLQPLTREARVYSQTVRIPERVSLDLYKVRQEGQKLRDKLGRDASDQELSDAAGLPVRRLAHVRAFERGERAESGLVDSEGALTYPGTSKIDPDQILLEYVHHDLTPVDQQILEWRTGLNGKEQLTNNEIARRLNLTPGAISQRAARIAGRINELKGLT
jgi:DNA-directed RNA polymerase specialized sigma subunit